mgnify:FL=1
MRLRGLAPQMVTAIRVHGLVGYGSRVLLWLSALVGYYEASGLGPPNGDRYMGPRLGPQVVQRVRVGLAQDGKL